MCVPRRIDLCARSGSHAIDRVQRLPGRWSREPDCSADANLSAVRYTIELKRELAQIAYGHQKQ
jgi:hypothetical protein